MKRAETVQATLSPSRPGWTYELAASAPETVTSTLSAQAASFVPTFPNSRTQQKDRRPANPTGPGEQSPSAGPQQTLQGRKTVGSDKNGELEKQDTDRESVRNAGSLAKMKPSIKSSVVSKGASTRSTALRNSAQTARSIYFDDLPSVLEVTAWNPSDRATESPDGDGSPLHQKTIMPQTAAERAAPSSQICRKILPYFNS